MTAVVRQSTMQTMNRMQQPASVQKTCHISAPFNSKDNGEWACPAKRKSFGGIRHVLRNMESNEAETCVS